MFNTRIRCSVIISLVSGLATAFATSANAAVTLSISNVIIPSGSVAIVGVYASSNSSDVISGFNLPLDVNDDGFTAGILPAGFKLDANDLRNSIYANTGLDTPQPQITLINVDYIATGSGGNVQLSSVPSLLFDLALDVAGTVPVGTRVPLEIEVPNAPFQTLFDVAGPGSPVTSAPTTGSPVYGSITVTSVPEPAGIALAALPALLLLTRRSQKA